MLNYSYNDKRIEGTHSVAINGSYYKGNVETLLDLLLNSHNYIVGNEQNPYIQTQYKAFNIYNYVCSIYLMSHKSV